MEMALTRNETRKGRNERVMKGSAMEPFEVVERRQAELLAEANAWRLVRSGRGLPAAAGSPRVRRVRRDVGRALVSLGEALQADGRPVSAR